MKKVLLILSVVVLGWIVWRFVFSPKPVEAPAKVLPKNVIINESPNMKITSTAFENNQNIPVKYTCDGENISPPLAFSEIPKSAKSLTLIVDDPDAPSGTFNHWIVY